MFFLKLVTVQIHEDMIHIQDVNDRSFVDMSIIHKTHSSIPRATRALQNGKSSSQCK